jgi:hypothetical protein
MNIIFLRFTGRFCLTCLLFLVIQCRAVANAIVTGATPTAIERYTALELQRYLYQLTGEQWPITTRATEKGLQFVVGTPGSNELIASGIGQPALQPAGDEGYLLQTKGNRLYIAANTPVGCLYGVYGLLEDHFGIGFYFSGDALPAKKLPFTLPAVSQLKTPSMNIRGLLPWTNFPQSATVYSWADWQHVIDQAARMRFNFIQVHNYNGEQGHNEMFHNFTLNGYTSRVWMPTAKTGHKWSCPGYDIKKYQFGGQDLFDDYDFGSDCALHNETLSNEAVFEKGVSLFQRVIAYAHTRGVKMGLGLDIDLIMPEYKTTADNPQVIEARMKQVSTDYPDLDYLILFISEGINNKPDKLALWKRVFDGMYAYMKTHAPQTRIAVAGWGLSKEIAATLPPDVIAAPISHYSDGFESGAIYGNREYWGCPWMERDFFSSEYYYPYDMHLSNTIKAWKAKAPNMKGLYTLTWRLTDAIDPKIAYIAKAPWDEAAVYKTSYDAYHDYAQKNYGAVAAKAMTDIINENEPYSCNDAECQPTGAFTGKLLEESSHLLNLRSLGVAGKDAKQEWLAHRYHTVEKARIEKRDDADSCIAFVDHGARLHYLQIDLGSGKDSFHFGAATTYPFASISLVLDSINGPRIARAPVPTTGGWHNWKPNAAPLLQKVTGVHDVYVLLTGEMRQQDQVHKANQQINMIDSVTKLTNDAGQRYAMQMVKARLAAARDHLTLSSGFPATSDTRQLPGLFPQWVGNFTNRITDISSLGNVQSVQNRYVQERYEGKVNALQEKAAVKFPTMVQARGTMNGAVISWQNNEPGLRGYHVYANGKKLNAQLIAANKTYFTDVSNSHIRYHVTAVSATGLESDASPAADCFTGKADVTAPQIVVISPPSTITRGAAFSIKARLLDNREYALQTATLHYRYAGEATWKKQPMTRRVKAVFTADVMCEKEGILEYFITATDGSNSSRYPQSGNNICAVERNAKEVWKAPSFSFNTVGDTTIRWQTVSLPAQAVYKIYRSTNSLSQPGSAYFLTFLPSSATQFTDNGFDFAGMPLKGVHYYTVSVMLLDGREYVLARNLRLYW